MSTADRVSPPMLLSMRDAARTLGISERTLWTLVHERQFPHVRLGRRLMFSRAALEAWIASQQVGGNVDHAPRGGGQSGSI